MSFAIPRGPRRAAAVTAAAAALTLAGCAQGEPAPGNIAATGTSSTGASSSSPTGSSSAGSSASGSNSATGQATIVIHADMVTSGSCVLNNRFPQGSQVVWRARVVGGATGQELDSGQVKDITVHLADGQTFPMHYGPHGKTHFFTAAWSIPKDYSTGTETFTITATAADGAQTSFHMFEVPKSRLIVIPASASPGPPSGGSGG